MVCKKCEKKLGKVICPDKWKDGARNASTGKDRVINENKLLTRSKKSGSNPYGSKCKLCKNSIHQASATYCQTCAYKKGLCAMCGKQILDISAYRQSAK